MHNALQLTNSSVMPMITHAIVNGQSAAGRRFPSLLASQTVGKWGPILLQDVYLIERLQSLNRERLPPRIGHPKGAGERNLVTLS